MSLAEHDMKWMLERGSALGFVQLVEEDGCLKLIGPPPRSTVAIRAGRHEGAAIGPRDQLL